MQSGLLSPDADHFSTPPTTPLAQEARIRPSLSRKSSRPSNLNIAQSPASWKPDVVVDDQPSPDPLTKIHTNGAEINGAYHNSRPPVPPMISPDVTMTQQLGRTYEADPAEQSHRMHSPPIRSPCFVHSQLQGASLKDWIQAKQSKEFRLARMGNQPSHPGAQAHDNLPDTSPRVASVLYSDDEESAGSLTKQLAETAVGVREMSKQLGRTRVRSNIQSVLIVTKARDNRLIKLTRQLALYLMLKPRNGGRGMIVYVDAQLRTSRRFDAAGIEREHPELFAPIPQRRASNSSLSSNSSRGDNDSKQEGQLRYWTAEMCSRSPQLFDFVVTLGGDGTVLFTSWLFQRIVPPVLSFALGSLGFLTNFDFADHESVMDNVIDNGIRVNLRMRFTCTVYRAVLGESTRRAVKKGETGEIMMKNLEKSGWEALEGGYPPHDGKAGAKDREIMCFTTRPVESFEVINDLVVDRGPSPYVSQLELFGDEHHLTTVQGDGLCVATPTGSTAYSLSAGGSLVHPEIPAILLTPICPHTLSFRPMLLPDSMELRVCVPFNSRSTAWASFDGRGRVELKQGDHIKITASRYPFPTVCADSQSTDWFNAISRTLKWNERERQKSFVVVEEGPSRKRRSRESSDGDSAKSPEGSPEKSNLVASKGDEEPGDEEDEVSDEEEDKFDIDDISSNESPTTKEDSPRHDAAEVARTEHQVPPAQAKIGREKVKENEAAVQREQSRAETAARILGEGNAYLLQQHRAAGDRTRSGLTSGVETPDRFAGPHPHPPKVSPRHVQFAQSSSSSSSSLDDTERGERDRIHDPLAGRSSGRSQTPRREDAENNATTPTTSRRPYSRSRSRDRHEGAHPRRAFAVWGQDESDSAASDSDT
ncbi:ATP-NAD kinase [Obba rivulosa]|uniref:ATP-NAD kinase n=1 Tax=Obba rivulosa TaxID=1052685 RepID=A0A8E2ASN1_9APHY|nr:ATP-NAD kinase [Obba rivulosa]